MIIKNVLQGHTDCVCVCVYVCVCERERERQRECVYSVYVCLTVQPKKKKNRGGAKVSLLQSVYRGLRAYLLLHQSGVNGNTQTHTHTTHPNTSSAYSANIVRASAAQQEIHMQAHMYVLEHTHTQLVGKQHQPAAQHNTTHTVGTRGNSNEMPSILYFLSPHFFL